MKKILCGLAVLLLGLGIGLLRGCGTAGEPETTLSADADRAGETGATGEADTSPKQVGDDAPLSKETADELGGIDDDGQNPAASPAGSESGSSDSESTGISGGESGNSSAGSGNNSGGNSGNGSGSGSGNSSGSGSVPETSPTPTPSPTPVVTPTPTPAVSPDPNPGDIESPDVPM